MLSNQGTSEGALGRGSLWVSDEREQLAVVTLDIPVKYIGDCEKQA
jgi:hypothetical protein